MLTCIYSVRILSRSATKCVRYKQTFAYFLKHSRTVNEQIFTRLLLALLFVMKSSNRFHEKSNSRLVADSGSDGRTRSPHRALLVEHSIKTKLTPKFSLFLTTIFCATLAVLITARSPEIGQVLEAAIRRPLKPNYQFIISKLLFLRIVLSSLTTSHKLQTRKLDPSMIIAIFVILWSKKSCQNKSVLLWPRMKPRNCQDLATSRRLRILGDSEPHCKVLIHSNVKTQFHSQNIFHIS